MYRQTKGFSFLECVIASLVFSMVLTSLFPLMIARETQSITLLKKTIDLTQS